ncbi:MAG: DNA polymerase III subunit delta [Sedimentisphaerales bacterium]|nr:DNA polymerase III subunit delta [Sedimentisphaerales bacterium]
MARKFQSDPPLTSCYVIAGKEPFLVARQWEQLLDRLLPLEQRAMCLYQPSSDNVTLSEVLDELRTLPFLAERRVVLLKEADSFVSEHREALERYLESPSSTGVLVMTVGTWRKNTRLAKKVTQLNGLIEIEEIKPWHMPQYAMKVAKKEFTKDLSTAAAQLLVELVGDDPGRISSEIEKLAIYIGQRPAITSEDIESLIGHNRTFGAFTVIDSIIAGNTTEALRRLRNMFSSDKNAEYMVVGAFAFHIRRMFSAKALLNKGVGPTQVASQCKIWNARDQFFRQIQSFQLGQIGGLLVRLAWIDHAVKTGRTSAPLAMEQFVLDLAIPRQNG